jgi:2-oxoisovalerate dehydrogenase E1 component
VESVLANIRGIKVVYPSNGADLKGLLKAAFLDPNPVVVLEHKGLYWSKIPGTEAAKCVEPDASYVVPIGRARQVRAGDAATVCAYGRGVYWALEAAAEEARRTGRKVEVLDLRSISPVDFEAVAASVKRTHRVLVVTEEPVQGGFAQALAGQIAQNLFSHLDAPPAVVGSLETPAIPLNEGLERFVLNSAERTGAALRKLLDF